MSSASFCTWNHHWKVPVSKLDLFTCRQEEQNFVSFWSIFCFYLNLVWVPWGFIINWITILSTYSWFHFSIIMGLCSFTISHCIFFSLMRNGIGSSSAFNLLLRFQTFGILRCTESTCLFISECPANDLPQVSHLCGLWPSWTIS